MLLLKGTDEKHECPEPQEKKLCVYFFLQGDSGGPLFCSRNNEWYQLGVFSWMAGNCDPNYPAVYSRVPYFIDWLEYNTGLRF